MVIGLESLSGTNTVMKSGTFRKEKMEGFGKGGVADVC
jgi:hypothetical protein